MQHYLKTFAHYLGSKWGAGASDRQNHRGLNTKIVGAAIYVEG